MVFGGSGKLAHWGRDKTTDISQMTVLNDFLNARLSISTKISPTFVYKGQINHILALAQIMAWAQIGNKPLWTNSLLTHKCVTQPKLLNS